MRNGELAGYGETVRERTQNSVAKGMDMEAAQEVCGSFREAYADVEVFETTAIIAEGLEPVLYRAADLLAQTPQFPIFDEEDDQAEGVLYKFEPETPIYEVRNLGNGQWELIGEKLERIFRMSKMNTEEDFMRFTRKMRKLGIDEALREAGCQDGDTVYICNYQFEFME